MRWETLTSDDFAKAATDTGVCVIAMGVVEKHGLHLPLGTDYMNGHSLAVSAAEKEPAIVFPPFYWGQIYEGRSFPGTLTLAPEMLMGLITRVFEEISRNGIKKILIYNAHGGNGYLVRYLAQLNLAGKADYTVYVPKERLNPERKKKWDDILDVKWGEHGHEGETAVSLAHFPEMVKMDRVPESGGEPLKRMEHMKDFFTGISWYANYPDHYSGDPRQSTPEKGKKLRQLIVDNLAEHIAMVKKDTTAPDLMKEFFSRIEH